jgi:hypothetical protein
MTLRLPASPSPFTLILASLATARLTRFVTTDWLGEWTIARPLKRWSIKHETAHYEALDQRIKNGEKMHEVMGDTLAEEPRTWQAKLTHGLDCPFCVGFWIGAIVLTATALTPTALKRPMNLALGAFALNYVVGHVSKKID